MDSFKWYSKFFQRSWAISSLFFGLDRFFKVFPPGWKLSFGFWIRWSADGVDVKEGMIQESRTSKQYHDIYHPLEKDHIRVLRILPGEFSDPIRVELESRSIHESSDHEALSYVWGRHGEERKVVELNGTLVDVLPNLNSALRFLRLPSKDRIIWVDALCINQADNQEKSKQITMMVDVYAGATDVLVWLGEATEYSDVGMGVMRYFANTHAKRSDAPWLVDNPDLLAKGLQDILSRSWWSRVWTIQEPAVARSVTMICGFQKCSWQITEPTLKKIIFKIKSASISPGWKAAGLDSINMQPILETLDMQWREIAAKGNFRVEKDILDIIYDFKHREAVDPRDKIFAMLGLVEGRQIRMHLRPDYLKSWEEIQEDFETILRQRYGFFEEDSNDESQ